MTPDNDDLKYKNLFRKNEEVTDIPEFDDILNLPERQKKHSGKLTKAGSVMILCLTLAIAIYFYQRKKHDAGISKIETELFQAKISKVWKWTSPTQQLLSASLINNFTSFNMPTDFLSLQKISLQSNNTKKNKLKK